MSSNWQAANEEYLMAAVDVVRAVLEWHVAQREGARIPDRRGAAQGMLERAATLMPARSALDTLCALFGLSAFERQVLLLCVAMELDADFSLLCAAVLRNEKYSYPTFQMARTVFGGHWDAFSPAGSLRYWQLIEVGAGDALTSSPLRIDERILHYLAGVNTLDARLSGIVEGTRGAFGGKLAASHQALVERVVAMWGEVGEQALWPVVQLCGAEAVEKEAIAAAVSARLGLNLHVCYLQTIPTTPSDLERLRRLWAREAILSNNVLFLACDEVEPSHQRAIGWLVEHTRGALIVSSQQRVRAHQRTVITFDVPRPSAAEQQTLWHEALGPLGGDLNGQVAQLVSQFNLSGPAIQASATSGLAHLGAQRRTEETIFTAATRAELQEALWESCRVQARPRLDDLAQRLVPSATWESLVLPELQRSLLRDIVLHVRLRQKVYQEWGFASQGGRGLGISALFAGASGTGKTMTAEVLANQLRLDLYRIDLSAVVSKYIGETEKNLRRIFDAAEAGGVILLFDEADALFGKRSEVKDSHDRHANIEVSYLLQRMEAYRGLAILTTNMKSALDSAFLRRIRFIVQFPFPNATQRAQIWQHIFPTQTPTEGLKMDKLAQLNIAGGHIRNIAMNAAFLAADADEPVRMTHLLRAARREYVKLERQLTKSEIRGWME